MFHPQTKQSFRGLPRDSRQRRIRACKSALASCNLSDEELRARLFQDRLHAFEQRCRENDKREAAAKSSPSSPSSSSSSSLPASDLETRNNNTRTMLIEHARSLLDTGNDIFMMSAQRRRAWRGNSYLISMNGADSAQGQGNHGAFASVGPASDAAVAKASASAPISPVSSRAPSPSSKSSMDPNFLGKLKSNFGGTEFVIWENGVKPAPVSASNTKFGAMAKLGSHAPSSSSSSSHATPSAASSAAAGSAGTPAHVSSKAVTPLHSPSHTSSPSPHCATPSSSSSSSAAMPPCVRYAREAGFILYDHFFEHTGSPIRIKVGLPNRSFHAQDNAASQGVLSTTQGALCKQWKLESKEAAALAANAALHPEAEAAAPAAGGLAIPARPVQDPKALRVPVSHATLDEFDEYSFQTPKQQVEQFENLRPVWHDGMNAYVLHFDHHRVREKSVKNFKLVRTLDGEKRTVLQFGRVVDRNVFVMDFSWPLTPFQAFCISLSSIDPKLAI